MERPKTVNIRDVAHLAGVSPTTVSHALGGARPVSEATRQKVREAAELLGYRPHPGARSLKATGTGVLGLCVLNFSDFIGPVAEMEYYFRLVTNATEAALEERFAMVVVPETEDGEFWDRLLLDGAVIVDPARHDPSVRRLRARGLPVVTIGREPETPDDGYWVDSDPEEATRLCLDHLAARGARLIAGVSFMTTDHWTQTSLRVYQDWCREHGQRPHLEIAADETDDTLSLTATRLLESDPRPDAVYGFYELPALHVVRVAGEMGISIPDELMVAASNDYGRGPSTSPPMTTLDYRADLQAREATQLLIELVRGQSPASPRRILPVTLIERESTRRA